MFNKSDSLMAGLRRKPAQPWRP